MQFDGGHRIGLSAHTIVSFDKKYAKADSKQRTSRKTKPPVGESAALTGARPSQGVR